MPHPLGKKQPKASSGTDTMKPLPDIVKASEANDLHSVMLALQQKPSCINDRDSRTHMTALHWAGANGNYEIAEALFKHTQLSVNPWLHDKWRRYPMHLAMRCGNTLVIELLFKNMFPEDFMYDFDPLDPPPGIEPILQPKFGEKPTR
jgi:ankyrin repeat protein